MATTPILYCFLQDDALKVPQRLDLNSGYDQGFGILSGEAKNYFIKPGIISDPRASRLNVIENAYGYGNLSLVYDQNRFDTTTYLSNMTDVEYALFFNIVERLYLQNIVGLNTLETDHFTSYQYTGNGCGYVARSSSSSDNITNGISFYDSDKRVHTISLRDWFSFTFERKSNVSGLEIKFKVYCFVSKSALFKNYPYTTITNVIPPYDPEVLMDPLDLVTKGNLSILTASSNYIFKGTNLEMVARDQSGVCVYKTKYIIDATRSVQLPFALPYCGANEPTTLECRTAIREFLEDKMDLADDQIEELFPELYIGSRFFIVPLWDMYYQATDREIFNSILNMNKLLARKAVLFDYYEDSLFVDKYVELMWQAYNKIPLMCMPDTLNSAYFSILKQHPTYQDYSTQTPGWAYMAASTQEFASKLIECMAILNGESSSDSFIEVTSNNKVYLSFTAGQSEYLVMTRDSYNTYVFE